VAAWILVNRNAGRELAQNEAVVTDVDYAEVAWDGFASARELELEAISITESLIAGEAV
jgi:hypothetical protein